MADRAALMTTIEERRAFTKEHSQWGLLPPQRAGVGLVLSIVSLLSIVAFVVAMIAGVGNGWSLVILVVGVVSNGLNISRTKKWVDTELAANA